MPLSDANHEQFLRLFAEHEPAIRAFARLLLQRREDVSGVLQDATVTLWQHVGEVHAWKKEARAPIEGARAGEIRRARARCQTATAGRRRRVAVLAHAVSNPWTTPDSFLIINLS